MRRNAAYWAAVALAALPLLWAAHPLLFRNQADFSRSVGFMLEDTIPATQWVWRMKPAFEALKERNISSWFFGALGLLQRPFGASYFLLVPALLGQVLLVTGIAGLAQALAAGETLARRLALFAGLVLVAFLAHNIGVMNSFYPEFMFFIGMPVLLLGMALPAGRWAAAALLVGGTLVGMAKVQYFYLPALAWLCIAVARRAAGGRVGLLPTLALAAAQVLALLPMGNNAYKQLNYYHSTYMGSYMVLTPAERQALGLTARQEQCIGGDVWGNRGTGPGGMVIVTSSPTCNETPIKTRQVFAPYKQFPSVLPRLAAFALPWHFTTAYFHVHPTLTYLMVIGDSNAGAQALQTLSGWRERLVTPLAPLVLVLSVALAIAGIRRRRTGLPAMLLFLPLLAVSQVVVSLVGEGIRDLSKHMWAAQLAIDLLLPLVAWQAYAILRMRSTWASSERRATGHMRGATSS